MIPETDKGVVALGVRWQGRVDLQDPGAPAFSWSGSGFEATFMGTELQVELENDDAFVFQVIVDRTFLLPLNIKAGSRTYTLASGLPRRSHTVSLWRQTEGRFGLSRLHAVVVPGGVLAAPGPAAPRLLEVIGDSITAGYGSLGDGPDCGFSFATQSHRDTYEAVAARELGAELSTLAVSGYGLLRDLTGSRENTLPALYQRAVTGNERSVWTPPRSPDAIVIMLGTNDFFVGDPGAEFLERYLAFVAELRALHPRSWIIGAASPMLGQSESGLALLGYLQAVQQAREADGDHRFAVFEIAASGTEGQGCDTHPNAHAHLGVGLQLADFLRSKLGW